MATVLLMLSGGLDSTYLLHYYLTQTDHEVHAHHISIQYPYFPRWKMEGPAVKKIVEFCRNNYRPFEYSESYFGFDFTENVGWDSDLQLMVASKVVLNLHASEIFVALGWCPEDLARQEVADRVRNNITTNLWRALWESIGSKPHISQSLTMPLVEMGLSKVDIIRGLPRSLLELCWSCRSPVRPVDQNLPCRQCGACQLNLRTLVAAGLQPKDYPNLA